MNTLLHVLLVWLIIAAYNMAVLNPLAFRVDGSRFDLSNHASRTWLWLTTAAAPIGFVLNLIVIVWANWNANVAKFAAVGKTYEKYVNDMAGR